MAGETVDWRPGRLLPVQLLDTIVRDERLVKGYEQGLKRNFLASGGVTIVPGATYARRMFELGSNGGHAGGPVCFALKTSVWLTLTSSRPNFCYCIGI